MQHFLSEVFMIIGGCTRDERFISTVTCLDPLRRSRLEVARMPLTEGEESHNRKWVEFACITFRKEVYISGESHSKPLQNHDLEVTITKDAMFHPALTQVPPVPKTSVVFAQRILPTPGDLNRTLTLTPTTNQPLWIYLQNIFTQGCLIGDATTQPRVSRCSQARSV